MQIRVWRLADPRRIKLGPDHRLTDRLSPHRGGLLSGRPCLQFMHQEWIERSTPTCPSRARWQSLGGRCGRTGNKAGHPASIVLQVRKKERNRGCCTIGMFGSRWRRRGGLSPLCAEVRRLRAALGRRSAASCRGDISSAACW